MILMALWPQADATWRTLPAHAKPEVLRKARGMRKKLRRLARKGKR
jgi:hypothetical protein